MPFKRFYIQFKNDYLIQNYKILISKLKQKWVIACVLQRRKSQKWLKYSPTNSLRITTKETRTTWIKMSRRDGAKQMWNWWFNKVRPLRERHLLRQGWWSSCWLLTLRILVKLAENKCMTMCTPTWCSK